jgi:hypothetical protein
LGKTDTALNLLVETIKRTLSENDKKIMLESIMLFCQVAGMLGNIRNEVKLLETCILKSIDASHIPSLMFSCLEYSQLNHFQAIANHAGINKVITPVPTAIKPGMPKQRDPERDPGVKTCVSL